MGKNKTVLRKGFSLLEILLVLVIIGVMTVFGIYLSGSITQGTKVNETKSRMEEIAAKARALYRSEGKIPVAGGGLTGTETPIGPDGLNMEQKHAYDAWGQPLRYYRWRNERISVGRFAGGPVTSVILEQPDIDGFQVDGKQAVGVIVSNGPNETLDSDFPTSHTPINISHETTTPAGAYDPFIIETQGDDILVPIVVSREAMEIAKEELRVLQDAADQLDQYYQKIDNDGDGQIDEDGCVAVAPTSTGTGCPPQVGLSNDPNCATATLDQIALNNTPQYDCALRWEIGPPVNFMHATGAVVDINTLSYEYLLDPWGEAYLWGADTLTPPKETTPGTAIDSSDRRFHKFYSMGPDTSIASDDITP